MPKKDFKYYDVYNQIKKDLIDGKYPAGSMLPTENELVEKYNASKTTIRHAAQLLEAERFIEKQQGRGTVVLEFYQYKSRHKYSHSEIIKVNYNTTGPGIPSNVGGFIEEIPASAEIAKFMNIPAGSPVFRIQNLQLIDGRVFGISTNYYRADYVPGLSKLKFRPSTDIYAYFEKEYDLHLDHIDDTLDTINIDSENAAQLGLYPDTPVLVIRRTGYSDKGIFQYSESLIRTDIFQMTITLNSDYFQRSRIN